MKNAELKTKKTDANVEQFLNTIADKTKRQDCFDILEMMKKVTKSEPKMWGPSIVGFGTIHLKYESGRELDWFICGFSPRKQNLTLYLMSGMEQFKDLLQKLGKHKVGGGCLYISSLDDINKTVLKEIIVLSYKKSSEKK
jgi:hypothetical protein